MMRFWVFSHLEHGETQKCDHSEEGALSLLPTLSIFAMPAGSWPLSVASGFMITSSVLLFIMGCCFAV